MDDTQRQHLEAVRSAHQRRLQVLERQAAIAGYGASPEVLTEIEDIHAAVAHITAQLGEAWS